MIGLAVLTEIKLGRASLVLGTRNSEQSSDGENYFSFEQLSRLDLYISDISMDPFR